jgi:hypothetical protein
LGRAIIGFTIVVQLGSDQGRGLVEQHCLGRLQGSAASRGWRWSAARWPSTSGIRPSGGASSSSSSSRCASRFSGRAPAGRHPVQGGNCGPHFSAVFRCFFFPSGSDRIPSLPQLPFHAVLMQRTAVAIAVTARENDPRAYCKVFLFCCLFCLACFFSIYLFVFSFM